MFMFPDWCREKKFYFCEATTLPTDVAKVRQTLQQFPVKSGEFFKGIKIWYADRKLRVEALLAALWGPTAAAK